ncbi:MAG: EpsG family protein [Clostridia bacterium]|nr:EpsG family protein [Clostridia bacterium]
MVYLVLVPAILFLPMVTDRIKNGKKVYFAIVTLLLIFFAGFRDLSVGTDTKSYVNGFLKCEPFSEVSWGEFIKEESEFLYFMYRAIIRQITENYVWFLLPISVFYIIVVSRFIYKYSDYPSISFLVFLAMSYYAFSMAGIRQTIGYTFLILATEALINRRRLLCCLFILIAGGFHVTSFLYFAVLLIDIIPFGLFFIAFIGVASVICYIYAMTFTQFFVEMMDKSETLLETEYGGNIVLAVVVLVSFAAMLLYSDLFKKAAPAFKPNGKKYMSEAQRDQFFMKMVLFSIPLLIMVLFQANIFRIAMMFHFYMMFLIPAVIKKQKDPYVQAIGKLVVYAALLAELFIFTYNAAEIFPYSFSF